jgi:long-chain fatty acid transport protein
MKVTCKAISCALVFAGLPGIAGASGFGLIESNANGQGSAYAGTGAVAENASTIFFNPAAMTLLPGRQMVVSVHAIDARIKFSDGNPATNDGGDAGDLAFLPNFYYAMPVGKQAWFGLGINVPFGLKTEYDANWVGSLQAIKSEMRTVNINPSIAVRLSDQVSVGAGLNAMYIKGELTAAYPLNPALTTKMAGDDWGYGFNLGVLYEFDQSTRLALSYRSKVKQKLTGELSLNAPVPPTPATAAVTLPDTLTLSAYKRIDTRWALLADISWTGWSEFQELKVVSDSGATLSLTPEHWKDTMRYSLGLHYYLNDHIKLRTGIGFDQSPVPSAQYRTPRIPDNDRTWIAIGLGYELSRSNMVDVAYSHLFVKDAPIAAPAGQYESSVDIVGLQWTHTF